MHLNCLSFIFFIKIFLSKHKEVLLEHLLANLHPIICSASPGGLPGMGDTSDFFELRSTPNKLFTSPM